MGIAQNKTKPARGPNMTYSQQQVAILNNVQADLDLDREGKFYAAYFFKINRIP